MTQKEEFEPNGIAGKAIDYMLKRWTELTQFFTPQRRANRYQHHRAGLKACYSNKEVFDVFIRH